MINRQSRRLQQSLVRLISKKCYSSIGRTFPHQFHIISLRYASPPTQIPQILENSINRSFSSMAMRQMKQNQPERDPNDVDDKSKEKIKEQKSDERESSEGEKKDSNEEQKKEEEFEEQDEEDFRKKIKKNKISLLNVIVNLLGIGVVFYILGRNSSKFQAQEITFQTFVDKFIQSPDFSHLEYELGLNRVFVFLLNGAGPEGSKNATYYFSVLNQHDFEMRLQDVQEKLGIPPSKGVKVVYVDAITDFPPIIKYLAYGLLWFGFPLYLLLKVPKGGRGGMMDLFGVGKIGTKTKHNVKVTFNDVAGMEEAKLEIQEFVSILKNPEKYQKLGAKTPRGAILMGPPGTGKTLLAKAVAGESKVPFFSISGSDFVEMFVGVGPARVRDLFKKARESKNAIIFIDEIDAIGRPRNLNSMYGGGNDERENTLNQLLVEMDGFSENENIVVMASTNVSKEDLDKALLRPGRFDRQIMVDKPDVRERELIFGVHLKPLKVDAEVAQKIEKLAQLTPGFTGADIANVCNEAAIYAARQDKEGVGIADIEKAIERIIGGLEKKNAPILPEDKRVIAFHEAGHAIVSWFVRYCDPLLKISIIPRGKALGYAQYLPKERYIRTYDALFDMVTQALGGRVAEKLIFNHLSTGAKDDLQKITRIAYLAASTFGMGGNVGLVSFPPPGDPSISVQKPYSEETAEMIDKEAKNIIMNAYEKAEKILTEKIDLLHKVAEYLLEHEVMSIDQFKNIVGPRPFTDTDHTTLGEETKHSDHTTDTSIGDSDSSDSDSSSSREK